MAQPQDKLSVKLKVDDFARSYGDAHRALACHAALPLLLTPELLNYLRNRFMLEQVPWVAEADLLLSDLCREVAYETYAMEAGVRAYLLSELRNKYGPQRMEEVARLLINYVSHLFRSNPKFLQHDLQTQQWAALVYLDDRREQAVRELAKSLRACVAQIGKADARHTAANQDEALRLSNLIKDLTHQLRDHPELVSYAELTSEVLSASGNEPASERLREHRQFRESTRVLDFDLPPLENLLPQTVIRKSGAATAKREAKRWAVLVGVSDYGTVLPSLSSGMTGVMELRDILRSLGYSVTLLSNPKHPDELRLLDQITGQSAPDDLFLFYFSGYVERGRTSPLLILSADAKDSQRVTSAGLFGMEAIHLSEIFNRSRLMAALNIVVILDPQVREGGRLLQEQVRLSSLDFSAPDQVFALMSPVLTEPAEHGEFTESLCNLLKDYIGNPVDEPLTLGHLADLLQREYRASGLKYGKERRVFYELNGRDIILAERSPDGARTEPKPSPGPFEVNITEHLKAFGRLSLLEDILNALISRRIVHLVGEAGLGKTALLKALCAVGPRRLDLPESAFVYLNLASIRDQKEFSQALKRKLHPSGMESPDKDDRLLDLISGLRGTRLVLCLDNIDRSSAMNFEHTLSILVERAPNVSLVVASRGLAMGSLQEVDTIRGIELFEVPPIAAAAAYDFFRERLAGTGVTFTDAEIEELLKLSKGHPNRLLRAATALFAGKLDQTAARRGSSTETGQPGTSPGPEATGVHPVTPAEPFAVATTASSSSPLPVIGYISYQPAEPSIIRMNQLLPDFVARLRAELSGLTSESVQLFFDRRRKPKLRNFEEQIQQTSFFVPVLSPGYFQHPVCRWELEQFLKRERQLTRTDLIFPITFGDGIDAVTIDDPLLEEIRLRQGLHLANLLEVSEVSFSADIEQFARLIVDRLGRAEALRTDVSASQPLRIPDASLVGSPTLKLKAVRSILTFESLSKNVQLELAKELKPVFFGPGKIVLERGTKDSTLYCVWQGELQQAARGEGKRPSSSRPSSTPIKVLNLMGILTGEGLDSKARWVAGVEGLVCYQLEKPALTHILSQEPGLADQIALAHVIAENIPRRDRAQAALSLSQAIISFHGLPSLQPQSEIAQAAFPSSGRTIVVDQRGRGNVGTIGETVRKASSGDREDVRTIGEAISKARSGDKILVRQGVYRETLKITKSLEIVGDTGEVVIEAKGKTCITFSADKGRLDRLYLLAHTRSNEYGVQVAKGALSIAGSIIEGFRFDGVEIASGASGVITGSIFAACSCGICVEGDAKIDSSDISRNRQLGIFVGKKGKARIVRNSIHDNKEYGISIDGGNAAIELNSFSGNGLAPVKVTGANKGTVQLLKNSFVSGSETSTDQSLATRKVEKPKFSPVKRQATSMQRSRTRSIAVSLRPHRPSASKGGALKRSATKSGSKSGLKKGSKGGSKKAVGKGSAQQRAASRAGPKTQRPLRSRSVAAKGKKKR